MTYRSELLERFKIDKIPIMDRGCESKKEVAKYFVKSTVEIARKVDKLFKTDMPIIIADEEDLKCEKCEFCKNAIYRKKSRPSFRSIYRQTRSAIHA